MTFAGGLGAVLLWLGIWLVQYVDATVLSPQITFMADLLRLEGRNEEGGAEGLPLPPQPFGRPALVTVPVQGLFAGDYSLITWDIPTLPEGTDLAVVWTSSTSAGKGHLRRINPAERASGRVTMESQPAWQGRIAQLGLLVRGAWTAPVLVESISLHRNAPSPLDVLISFWNNWTFSEPWTQRSINFHRGVESGRWLTPIPILVLWVVFSFLVYIPLSRQVKSAPLTTVFACLVLTAWFLFDARWQWQLGQRLLATYQTYGGLSPTERAGAAPDGKISVAARLIREKLPVEQGRIFIIHQEASAYLPERIRYHLLPYPSYAGFSTLPGPKKLRVGDHLLVMANITGIRYDPQEGKLVSAKRNLPVAPKLAIPGFGTLYRVE